MFDGLPTALENWGPTGLLTLAVLMIFIGGLIPRWMHNERIKDKEARIIYLEAALDRRDAQVDELLAQGRLIVGLLEALNAKATEARQ